MLEDGLDLLGLDDMVSGRVFAAFMASDLGLYVTVADAVGVVGV